MPSTRCARRGRAHRQGRARAAAAPQRGVGRPPPALRGDGGVAAAIRRRAGCCGGGGGGGRAVRDCGSGRWRVVRRGDGTQLHGARFGPHSLLCSHRALCSSGGPPRRSAAAVCSVPVLRQQHAGTERVGRAARTRVCARARVRVCVCVRARVRACARACVRACVHLSFPPSLRPLLSFSRAMASR